MKPYLFPLLILAILTTSFTLAEELCLFDTSEVYDDSEIRPGFEMWATDETITQPFYTGDADAITSVSLDARHLKGSPSGRLNIEVWDDDGAGKPKEKVGTFGSLEIADLPAGSKRPVVLTTVAGEVSGLKPQSHYHLIMNHEEAVFRPPLERDVIWYSTSGSDPMVSGARQAHTRGDFTNNVWKTLESIVDAKRRFLVMKIVGKVASAPDVTYTLSITASDHGTVTKSPDQDTYPVGSEIALTATPNEGNEFTKWLIGEKESTDNPVTISIEADTVITPEFVALPTDVAIYSNIPDPIPPDNLEWIFLTEQTSDYEALSQAFMTGDTGIISSMSVSMVRWRDPSGPVHVEIWDDSDGKPGTKLHSVTTIDVNNLVHGRNHSNANPDEVVQINGLNIALEANTLFHLVLDHSETQLKDGNGSTRKTVAFLTRSSSNGTNGVGRLRYTGGTDQGTLASIPGFGGVNYLAMEVRELASAPIGDTFTLTVPQHNSGNITITPDGPYPAGTEITLTATPNEGFEFSKWLIGETESTDNPLIFTIETDTTITPEFAEIQASFTLSISSSDGGIVTADPDMETYPAGTVVTLTSTPNEGYTLASWSGDTNEEGNPPTITLTMNGDKSVTATFRTIIVPEITAVVFDRKARTVSLTWPSHANADYAIEMSTDLLGWESLGTQTSVGTQTTALVDMPGNDRRRFYRLREKP